MRKQCFNQNSLYRFWFFVRQSDFSLCFSFQFFYQFFKCFSVSIHSSFLFFGILNFWDFGNFLNCSWGHVQLGFFFVEQKFVKMIFYFFEQKFVSLYLTSQPVHLTGIFNCSWTKFMAITVNVCLFYAKFLLDNFDFSSDFYVLDFLRLVWSKILSQSQFQSAEFNWRQFNTKSQMKSAPKLVPFFTLNLNSGIC